MAAAAVPETDSGHQVPVAMAPVAELDAAIDALDAAGAGRRAASADRATPLKLVHEDYSTEPAMGTGLKGDYDTETGRQFVAKDGKVERAVRPREQYEPSGLPFEDDTEAKAQFKDHKGPLVARQRVVGVPMKNFPAAKPDAGFVSMANPEVRKPFTHKAVRTTDPDAKFYGQTTAEAQFRGITARPPEIVKREAELDRLIDTSAPLEGTTEATRNWVAHPVQPFKPQAPPAAQFETAGEFYPSTTAGDAFDGAVGPPREPFKPTTNRISLGDDKQGRWTTEAKKQFKEKAPSMERAVRAPDVYKPTDGKFYAETSSASAHAGAQAPPPKIFVPPKSDIVVGAQRDGEGYWDTEARKQFDGKAGDAYARAKAPKEEYRPSSAKLEDETTSGAMHTGAPATPPKAFKPKTHRITDPDAQGYWDTEAKRSWVPKGDGAAVVRPSPEKYVPNPEPFVADTENTSAFPDRGVTAPPPKPFRREAQPIETGAFVSATESSEQYTEKQGEGKPIPRRPAAIPYVPNTDAFYSETEAGVQFIPKPMEERYRKPKEVYVPNTDKLETETEARKAFNGPGAAAEPPRKPIKYKDGGDLMGGEFYGVTTAMDEFTEKKADRPQPRAKAVYKPNPARFEGHSQAQDDWVDKEGGPATPFNPVSELYNPQPDDRDFMTEGLASAIKASGPGCGSDVTHYLEVSERLRHRAAGRQMKVNVRATKDFKPHELQHSEDAGFEYVMTTDNGCNVYRKEITRVNDVTGAKEFLTKWAVRPVHVDKPLASGGADADTAVRGEDLEGEGDAVGPKPGSGGGGGVRGEAAAYADAVAAAAGVVGLGGLPTGDPQPDDVAATSARLNLSPRVPARPGSQAGPRAGSRAGMRAQAQARRDSKARGPGGFGGRRVSRSAAGVRASVQILTAAQQRVEAGAGNHTAIRAAAMAAKTAGVTKSRAGSAASGVRSPRSASFSPRPASSQSRQGSGRGSRLAMAGAGMVLRPGAAVGGHGGTNVNGALAGAYVGQGRRTSRGAGALPSVRADTKRPGMQAGFGGLGRASGAAAVSVAGGRRTSKAMGGMRLIGSGVPLGAAMGSNLVTVHGSGSVTAR